MLLGAVADWVFLKWYFNHSMKLMNSHSCILSPVGYTAIMEGRLKCIHSLWVQTINSLYREYLKPSFSANTKMNVFCSSIAYRWKEGKKHKLKKSLTNEWTSHMFGIRKMWLYSFGLKNPQYNELLWKAQTAAQSLLGCQPVLGGVIGWQTWVSNLAGSHR